MNLTTCLRAAAVTVTLGLAAAGVTAGPAVASSADPQSPATATQSDSERPNWAMGSRLVLRNDTGGSIWVSNYVTFGTWSAATELTAGRSVSFTGRHAGSDDIELRIFRAKPSDVSNLDRIEVDVENPTYSTPWMSVASDSEYFNQHSTHYWTTGKGAEFWGKRDGDSDRYKEFQLHMKKSW